MPNTLDFSGIVALVAGAAAGMGLATTRAFARAVAVVVVADFREDLVKTVAADLVAAGHKAIAVRCDVADDDRSRRWSTERSPSEKASNDLARNVPIGRAGRPEEIAAAVLWLCSPGASDVVGHALTIDGGMTVAG